ncbi:DUF2358 domain-containing protein [Leptolyngbya cf. ectocarpi LEGE 11479]|uniref:DUF2358 domain-containing protein n=1 Tax=Leptolyngbya cf. ectocarpi LEGE 11479 TaxID=1828722 RepID=A0A928ZTN6_LEPEC|nr:DUF2358 domain-containing protein [Leptolyngbya cf. ectocarpi LEGE 11479]
MTVIDQVKADYTRFPQAQSYHLYAKDVYFKDPMNEFHGVTRYRQMIGFIEQWFQHIELELHGIDPIKTDRFTTQWTLHFTAPLPWQPRITIPGWSELQLNDAGLICSHIDYWNCSRWQVALQLFQS